MRPVRDQEVYLDSHLAAPRRDPAPSRTAYRLERLLLTPIYRRALRIGVPVLLVAAVAGIYLASAERRQGLADAYGGLREAIENRPEFMVTLMAVDGASAPLADAVRNVARIEFPVSSFQLDLPAIRAQVERIDAVARAEVRVRPGGILQIDVTERSPAMVWRTPEGLFLVDGTGHRIAGLTAREARPDLPLVAGEGAERAIPEALAIFKAAQPVEARLRGLERVGRRRWDLILDRDQVIRLPEAGAVEAVERVMALDQVEDLLARDVTVVDMRNPRRPTLRLTAEAAARFRGDKPEKVAKLGVGN